MTKDSEIWIRPGPIRSKAAQRVRPFVHQALAAAQKAGATVRHGQLKSGKSHFGRGRAASLRANRLLTNRIRQAVVKAHVVRHRGQPVPLKAHLRYLQREGVTQDDTKAKLFGPGTDEADGSAFAERTADDRHHFRFIVSPDDAAQMEDLKAFTRDLMNQAEQDLGTRLDWVAVDHWNTEHPHIHVVVRGKTDQGDDLVISRDYIKEGLRARAQNLITLELGERTDLDIRRTLQRQIESDRLTQLDRQMLSDQTRTGFVDLAPPSAGPPDELHVLKAGRMRKLERLGLASQFAPAQWIISEQASTVLRELGERNDIIKRIHRGLTEAGIERATTAFALDETAAPASIVGRLVDRGLDDELKGSAYVIIDGTDGRTHHVRLPTLEASGDAQAGAIVEVQQTAEDSNRAPRLLVRSDLPIDRQVMAVGATWLDRVAVSGETETLASTGFGAEARQAIRQRAAFLADIDLADERSGSYAYARDLLSVLKRHEFAAVTADIAEEIDRSYTAAVPGGYASGTYVRRINLASGRFAMLDDSRSFTLVPWSPSMDSRLGQHIAGVVRGNGSVDWSFNRKRDLGL